MKRDTLPVHQPADADRASAKGAALDLIRLNRREFLRGSAVAVAGAGLGLIHPPSALAQQPSGPVVSHLLLLNTSATRVEDQAPTFCDDNVQVLIGRHAYRFDYQYAAGGPQTIPNDLVATYRDGLCDITNELQRVLKPAPFKTPSDMPAEFPPPPPLGNYGEVDCYRLVQPLTSQSVRVYEWCSFYCGFDNDQNQGQSIIIQVGGPNGHLQYDPMDPGVGPPIAVHVENPFPNPRFNLLLPSGKPDVSLGARYYSADNQQQGFSEETLWTTNLPIRERQDLRVDAFIPGAAQPAARTAQAVYEVTHADGTALVKVSQRLAASAWVNLGTFTFENGMASVHLTNETGEPAATTEVVANAVRWANA
jgi:hypothetical protein